MGNYNMSLDKTKKEFSIKLEGFFTQPDAVSYLNEFNQNIKTINPKEYELSFDAKNLKVSTQDMLPLLEQCFQLYKQVGFKKVVMDMGTSPILKMQVKRVATNAGLDNCTVL